MDFRKRVTVLGSVAAALAVVYILSFVFSPQSRSKRGASWMPLDAKAAKNVSRVTIKAKGETIPMRRDEGVWMLSFEGELYPAKETRIDDLLAALSKKAEYPTRASKESAWEMLGVGPEADKIVLEDGNITLAELFFGMNDTAGKDIYIRSAAAPVVRSGTDVFSAYLNGTYKTWFDLRFFPDDAKKPAVDKIQRVAIIPPPPKEGEAPAQRYTLTRSEDGWQFEGGGGKAKKTEVESSLRYMLDASGEDFISAKKIIGAGASPSFDTSSGGVVLETGDGKTFSVTTGPIIEGRQTAKITGSDYIYVISEWSAKRIWPARTELAE